MNAPKGPGGWNHRGFADRLDLFERRYIELDLQFTKQKSKLSQESEARISMVNNMLPRLVELEARIKRLESSEDHKEPEKPEIGTTWRCKSDQTSWVVYSTAGNELIYVHRKYSPGVVKSEYIETFRTHYEEYQ